MNYYHNNTFVRRQFGSAEESELFSIDASFKITVLADLEDFDKEELHVLFDKIKETMPINNELYSEVKHVLYPQQYTYNRPPRLKCINNVWQYVWED